MSHAVKHVVHSIGHVVHKVWHSVTHHPLESILGAAAGLAGAGLLGVELPGVLGTAEHGVGSLLGISSASAGSAGAAASGVLSTAAKVAPIVGAGATLLNKPKMPSVPKAPSLNIPTDFTEDKNSMLGSKSLFGYQKSKTTFSNSAFAKTYSFGDLNSLLNEG